MGIFLPLSVCRSQRCKTYWNIDKRFIYIAIWYQSLDHPNKWCTNKTVCRIHSILFTSLNFDSMHTVYWRFFFGLFSSNHNIHLKTEANFTAGQRVYVSGKLRSSPLRTNDGKMVTSSTVKASQLYVLDNECGGKSATSGDRNHVELLGNISSEVTRKSDHSTFSVATHFDFK